MNLDVVLYGVDGNDHNCHNCNDHAKFQVNQFGSFL